MTASLRRAIAIGARVYLRRPSPRDERELRTLRRKSAAFLRPWEPAPQRGGATAGFAARLRGARSDRHERLLVCRLEDHVILGVISISEIVRGPAQSAFLGYWIGADHARRGYMTEALQLALRHALVDVGLHRVEANIQPENRASIALVRRTGFRLEGYSPRYLKIAGRWADHQRWALLEEDWRLGLHDR